MLQPVCCDVKEELTEELGGTKNCELVDTAHLSQQDGKPDKDFLFFVCECVAEFGQRDKPYRDNQQLSVLRKISSAYATKPGFRGILIAATGALSCCIFFPGSFAQSQWLTCNPNTNISTRCRFQFSTDLDPSNWPMFSGY